MAPRTVTPPPRGLWRLVGRAQRLGFSAGLRGKGGHWLALGVGAWGLQRLRSLAAKDTEILLSEPLGPGQRIVITNETITRVDDEKQQQRARRRAAEEAKAAKRAASRRGRRAAARAARRSRRRR